MSEEQKSEQNQAPEGRQPVFLLPGVVTALGGLMVAVHIAAGLLDPAGLQQLIFWFGFVPLRIVAGADDPTAILPILWTPVTYAFLHANWEHLLINVAWLAIFATPVARRYGALPTVGIFLLSAVAGAAAFALTALVFGSEGIFLIGASGGVAGLTGAAVRFIFQPVLYTRDTETGAPVPLGRRLASLADTWRNPRSRYFTLIWVILNAAVPLLPMLMPGLDQAVAWQAHLGGFFCGLLLVPLFERRA